MSHPKTISLCVVVSVIALLSASCVRAQVRALEPEEPSVTTFSRDVAQLQLEESRRVNLENAVRARDYKRAETILVEEAEREPKSPRAAKALVLAGGIFFLDGQYLNSAIAWKKAEAISPLDDRSRFTLAMAYIKLNRRDWARPELEKLTAANPENALYLYWLARLDYDGRNYTGAITRLRKVLQLDPKMMRAYDSLGLCYDYLGEFNEAIANYEHAIELNRVQPKPSPWPHVDLAGSLISVNRLADAERSLREAVGYDTGLAQAHYQLGRVLEMRGDLQGAVSELEHAATLDATFPEPHLLLGRIYHRLEQPDRAKAEIARFQQLKAAANGTSVAHTN